MKRLLTAILTLAILCSLFVPVSAENRYEVPLPFNDVKPKDWYYFDVCYVYDKELMNGVSETAFSPNGSATRAMIATILWRMEGSPEPSTLCTFTDVSPNAWYAKSVSWMQETGLTTGSGNNKFSPDKSITREELATFFYRYALKLGEMIFPIIGDVSPFADSTEISSWALESMQWVVGEHIMEGTGNNRLAPSKTATRAEIAAVMYRFNEIDFSQKRLVRIEATGDPEKLIVPLYCESLIFWKYVTVTGYFNDGSIEIIPRGGESLYWGIYDDDFDTSKLGPVECIVRAGSCRTTLTITVVEALPYTPLDIEAAMEFGNQYGESLGYKVDLTFTKENSAWGPPDGYTIGYLNKYGGQDALIEAIKGNFDALKRSNDYFADNYGENIRIQYIRCYIEFVETYDGKTYNEYWIYIFNA